MDLMTREQFQVVKLMQEGGATPRSFAKHTHEPLSKMKRAFDAPNYESYLNRPDFFAGVAGVKPWG
jgi:hypothetical protein